MKTTQILAASAVVVALTVGCISLRAGDIPTGKGGALLLIGKPGPVDDRASVAEVVMNCPKCKDQIRVRTDYSARGANKPKVTVVTHLCDTCGTKLTRVGHGKQATTMRTHTCAQCNMGS